MKWKLVLAGFVGFVAVAAFLVKRALDERSYQVAVSIFFSDGPNSRTAPMRIVQKGIPEKTLVDAPSFTGFGLYRIDRKIPVSKLRVQMEGLDGWQDCHCEQETRDGKVTLRPAFSFVHLWIDNLDGPAAKLKCGDHEIHVEARSKADHVLPTPLQNPVKVLLNDKEIGAIPPQKTDKTSLLLTKSGLLVDCSGRNHYRLTRMVYETTKNKPLPEPYSPGEIKTELKPAFLHDLHYGDIDYFLVPAPQTIQVQTYGPPSLGSRTHRRELVRN